MRSVVAGGFGVVPATTACIKGPCMLRPNHASDLPERHVFALRSMPMIMLLPSVFTHL